MVGVIRVDHKFFHVGIRREAGDKAPVRDQEEKRQDHPELRREYKNHGVDQHEQEDPGDGGGVSFYADDREDKRVFY